MLDTNTSTQSPTSSATGEIRTRQPIVDKTPAAHAEGATSSAVIELRVRNHPGVMSHITGLFARRAFNLEAILCVPEPDGGTSGMLLLVASGPKLEQIERQLVKLHDVLELRHRPDLGPALFARLQW